MTRRLRWIPAVWGACQPDQAVDSLMVTLPQVLSSFEFAPAVLGCCIRGGSGGLRCGAVPAAQHRITSRVDCLSELGRRHPAESRVWSMIVVIAAPV